jgi:aspartate aminotransferase
MRSINADVLATPHSGIREIVNQVVGLPNVIRLEIGQPDFGPPSHVIESVAAGLASSAGYTASAGVSQLRDLIVEKLRTVNGITAARDDVTVTVGAMGGIAATMLAVCRKGDRVLIPDVSWPNFAMVATALGLEVALYRCGADSAFKPDLDSLEAQVTRDTALIVVNSPSNPTGTMISRGDMEALVEFSSRNDIWLLSDETYDQLIYDGDHVSPATMDPDGRVISVFSFSKTYAMPGWRVGYVVAPRSVSVEIQKLQEPLVSCAPSIGQLAAIAALLGPQEFVADSVRVYRTRRDSAIASLSAAGLVSYVPDGAFYVLVDVSGTRMRSREFALSLLREEGVACAPGSAFGSADSYVRLCFAAESEALQEGVRRLIRFVQRRALIDQPGPLLAY